MSVIDIIQYEGDNQTFVWKYPSTGFNTGSQLIVRESQEALFFYNGQLLERYGAGKHIIKSENVPVVKGFLKLATGGNNPFVADLYFVNLTEQMAIRWGTDSKITYMDPLYNFPLEIGACGEMSLSVKESAKLLIKLTGTEEVLSQESLVIFLRSILLNRVKTIISSEIQNRRIGVFEIDMHLKELSQYVKDDIHKDFEEYGINLERFLITTILKPDEDPNYIRFKDLYYRQNTDLMEAELQKKLSIIDAETNAKRREIEGFTYQQEKGFEIAKDMANNEAVGQLNNVGIGLGVMTGIGGEMGKTIGGVAGEAVKSINNAANGFCSNCGYKFTSDMNFCPKCGTKRVN